MTFQDCLYNMLSVGGQELGACYRTMGSQKRMLSHGADYHHNRAGLSEFKW